MTQATLGTIIADFETSLATKMVPGDTSATLLNYTDDDGVALPTGKRYFFTIDGDNSSKEHISCNLDASGQINQVKSVSRQGVETTGVNNTHRVGAKVVITDFAHIKKINDLLAGTTDLDSSVVLKYSATASITQSNELATKNYVDGVAIAGAPAAGVTQKGIGYISTGPVSATGPIFVGDNDPRVPPVNTSSMTTGIVAAFAGSTGTPSSGNKFITNNDTTGTGLIPRASVIGSATNFFGDGSDGNVTITGTTTLTRDMYYNNLTINVGGVLIPAHYRVFIKDTFTNNGTVRLNGGNGGNGATGNVDNGAIVAGGSAGTIAAPLAVYSSVAGATGGSNTNTPSGNGDSGISQSVIGVGLNGSAGGQGATAGTSGGSGAGNGGGSSGGVVTAPVYNPMKNILNLINMLEFVPGSSPARIYGSAGAAGGGAGGTGGRASTESWGHGGSGGGSGASGGTIFIFCKTWAGNGVMEALGGNGGNGGAGRSPSSGTNSGGGGGGGGGAGGNGGVIGVAYVTKTYSGTVNVTGGNGGLGGAGATGQGSGGTGANGSNGANGSSGTTYEFILL